MLGWAADRGGDVRRQGNPQWDEGPLARVKGLAKGLAKELAKELAKA